MLELRVNGKDHQVDVDPDTSLLWVIREKLGLTGTRFGCGMALCGVCTVHLDGEAIRSCVTPVSRAVGKEVTTIEGLAVTESRPSQEAWVEEEVPRCRYCQSGQVLSAAVLRAGEAGHSVADLDDGMTGNICRCGTSPRIRQPTRRTAEAATNEVGKSSVSST